MPTFTYLVTIDCADADEANVVIGERLGFDEDYGFSYTLDFACTHAPTQLAELQVLHANACDRIADLEHELATLKGT